MKTQRALSCIWEPDDCQICLLEKEKDDEVYTMGCCGAVVHLYCINRVLGSRCTEQKCVPCQASVDRAEIAAVVARAKEVRQQQLVERREQRAIEMKQRAERRKQRLLNEPKQQQHSSSSGASAQSSRPTAPRRGGRLQKLQAASSSSDEDEEESSSEEEAEDVLRPAKGGAAVTFSIGLQPFNAPLPTDASAPPNAPDVEDSYMETRGSRRKSLPAPAQPSRPKHTKTSNSTKRRGSRPSQAARSDDALKPQQLFVAAKKQRINGKRLKVERIEKVSVQDLLPVGKDLKSQEADKVRVYLRHLGAAAAELDQTNMGRSSQEDKLVEAGLDVINACRLGCVEGAQPPFVVVTVIDALKHTSKTPLGPREPSALLTRRIAKLPQIQALLHYCTFLRDRFGGLKYACEWYDLLEVLSLMDTSFPAAAQLPKQQAALLELKSGQPPQSPEEEAAEPTVAHPAPSATAAAAHISPVRTGPDGDEALAREIMNCERSVGAFAQAFSFFIHHAPHTHSHDNDLKISLPTLIFSRRLERPCPSKPSGRSCMWAGRGPAAFVP